MDFDPYLKQKFTWQISSFFSAIQIGMKLYSAIYFMSREKVAFL